MKTRFVSFLCKNIIFTLTLFVFCNCSKDVFAGDLNFHAVNIGRGDALIIESDNHYMLVDSGTTKTSDILLSYLEKLNIPERKIDCIVATHPDGDHVGGFTKVLETYDVGHIYYSPCIKTSSYYYNFVNAAKAEGCPMEFPKAGQTWTIGDSTVHVIYDGTLGSTYNESSIVLKVTCDNKSILLTGDMPSTIERLLISQNYDFKADILKVGHHGAASSSCADFLDAVSPQYAVISCNDPKYTSLPKASVLKRLARRFVKTYRTTDGDILINIHDGVISTSHVESNPYISIKKGTITLSNNIFFATGKDIKPSVTLHVNGEFVSPSQYNVIYSSNKNTGVAKIKLVANELKFVSKCSTTFLILPQKESLKATCSKKNKVKLKWKKETNATGYVIQYSTDKSFKKKVKTIIFKDSHIKKTYVTNLKQKTKYYFRVKAYKSNVGDGQWSKTVKIKTTNIKATKSKNKNSNVKAKKKKLNTKNNKQVAGTKK